MKRYFWIPSQINGLPTTNPEENGRLQQVVLTAIRRAVETSSVGALGRIVVTDPATQGYPEELFAASRYRSDRETYVVPSYDDNGNPTEIPVQAMNFAAESIFAIPDRVIEQAPPFQGTIVLSLPGNHYIRIQSHRYATTTNIGRAYEWGKALFGAEAWAIVKGTQLNGDALYYIAALDEALSAAGLHVQAIALAKDQTTEGFSGRVLETLPGGYQVAAVVASGGGFTAPDPQALQQFMSQVRQARQEGATELNPQVLRRAVFAPIDDLIARGGSSDLEQAAKLLAELNAAAFAVLDWETKALYLRILVDAWTHEAQEIAIIEIIKSMGSRSELLAALEILKLAGKYDQLFDDLDSQLWSLLVVVGERFGQPGSITFDFLVELLQQAGLVPRSLDATISKIALSPADPRVSADLLAEAEKSVLSFVAETKEAVLSFGRFLRGTVEGIVILIADPGKLFEGIGQLMKLVVMVELARWGHKPSLDSLDHLLRSMEQKVVHGLKGAQVLGVSDKILRRIKWALIWEIASWLIGVGEVKAIFSSVGITDKLSGVARFIRTLGLFGKAAEAEQAVSKLEHLAKLLSKVSVISHEENVFRLISHLPEKDITRLSQVLESVDVHTIQNMAELVAKHPTVAEVAQHALGRAEALATLELKVGNLTENLVQGFQQLAERSGFNNQELLNLMTTLPAEHAELFMRAVQSIPMRALGRGVGTRSFGFLQNLAERPRSMQFLIDAGYDSFSALYRHSGYDILRFEENLAALADIAKQFPGGQREVEFQRFLNRLQNNDSVALQQLRDARRSAAGLLPIRSFTAFELDEIIRTTPDIRKIRQLAQQMDNSTAGSLFERWVNHYVFHEPIGTPRARLSLRRTDNPHLNLERDRSSDFFLRQDDSLWDSKLYQSGGEINVFQLYDYRKMEAARFVVTADGQRRKVNSINYIFSDRAAAEANLATLNVQGGAVAWFIDDHGVLHHLN